MDDLASYQAPDWSNLYPNLQDRSDGNEIVLEFLENIDHDVTNKLFYDLLETVEGFFFDEVMDFYWADENKKKDKVELLLFVASYVKFNCKHFKLASIAKKISREIEESKDAIKILKYFQDYCEADEQSKLILLIEESKQLLSTADLSDVEGPFEISSTIVEKCLKDRSTTFDSKVIVTAAITAEFYGVAYKYHIKTGECTKAYNEVRLYTQYIDLNTLSDVDKNEAAIAMMTCCLVAENSFDYGDILEQPLVKWLSMKERQNVPQFAEALELLFLINAFNDADMNSYESKMKDLSNTSSSELLRKNLNLLNLKMQLMIILDLCFLQQRGSRVLSFDEIAQATHIHDPIEIQYLLIKAMGNKLVEGEIDSIDKTVTITRTKAQAITAERATKMAMKYDQLIQKAGNVLDFMKDLAGTTLLNAEKI